MKIVLYTCPIAIILSAVLLLGSCVKEKIGDGSSAASEYALRIRPDISRGNSTMLTKAVDTDNNIVSGDLVDARDALRENFFSTLDIFIKRSDASEDEPWLKTWHLSASDANSVIETGKYDSKSLKDQALQLLSSNWGDEGIAPGTKYDIYVSANNPHTAAGVAPANLTSLKALSTYEHNIFRYYKNAKVETWDSHMRDEKEFLMDGKIEGWQIDPRSKEQVFNVDMHRAAAKIIVNIRYSDEKRIDMVSEDETKIMVGGVIKDKSEGGTPDKGSIKEYFDFVGREPGEPRWKYVSFGFKTSDFAEGGYFPDYSDIGNGELQEGIQTYSRTFNVEKLPADIGKENISSSYQIVTYSYPVNWEDKPDKAPCILLLSIYSKKEDQSDYKINYYRIPVCDERAVSSLERDHIYIVNVDIASLGSSTSPLARKDEELRIEYHVLPWTIEDIAQNATTSVLVGDTKYLMVTPKNYTLKGDDIQTVNLQWFASVSKDDNRIVDIDNNSFRVTYVNYLGKTVDITGTPEKTVLSDGTIQLRSEAPANTANGETVIVQILPTGYIRVLSEALASKAVKDISFRIRLNNTSFYEDIHLRHFPMDNIQSIEGWWASKVDGHGTASSTNGRKLEFSDTEQPGWSQYTANGQKRWFREVDAIVESVTTSWMLYDQYYQRNKTISYGIFTAKAVNFDRNSRYPAEQIGAMRNPSNNNYRPGWRYSPSMSSLNNNQMYVIQTTATSDNYILGRPVLDNNYQSQDICVSPAFMIASQLGAVTGTNKPLEAANHCGTYMEVGVDGKHYLGWRLPTGAEIGAILNYQKNPNTNGKTIVEVLGGAYYWALDGKAYSKNNGFDYTVSGRNYVRCVRDLKLEEVNRLNGNL